MNHLLYGLSLVIVLNAQECNEKRTEETTAKGTSTAPSRTEGSPAVSVEPSSPAELTGKRWYIISINGGDLVLPEGGERPWIEFNEGRIQGFTGCNNLMGGYTMEAGRMTFNEVGSTKKYCPEVQATERSIMDMLSVVTNYDLKAGTLTLRQGTNEAAVLKVRE